MGPLEGEAQQAWWCSVGIPEKKRRVHAAALVGLLMQTQPIRLPEEVPEVLAMLFFLHVIEMQLHLQNAARFGAQMKPEAMDFDLLAGSCSTRAERDTLKFLGAYLEQRLVRGDWDGLPARLLPVVQHPVFERLCIKLQQMEALLWRSFEGNVYKQAFARMQLEARLV
jgi:hypothetical protein